MFIKIIIQLVTQHPPPFFRQNVLGQKLSRVTLHLLSTSRAFVCNLGLTNECGCCSRIPTNYFVDFFSRSKMGTKKHKPQTHKNTYTVKISTADDKLELPVIIRSQESSILSSTSFQLYNTFQGMASTAIVEKSRRKANMAAPGDGKFAP